MNLSNRLPHWCGVSSHFLLKFLLFLVASLLRSTAADWPGWRGIQRDGLSLDPLPNSIPSGLQPRWRKKIGHGYSGPVQSGNRLIYLDDAGGRETVHCLNSVTGNELWKQPFAELYADEFEAGPRCTPLVDTDRIFVQSCYGEFACLSMTDGTRLWGFHFGDYGMTWVKDKSGGPGAASRRGNSGSPVLYGDQIIVQVGSTQGAAFVAFNAKSGKYLWKSQNDLTSYASAIVGKLGGRNQAVAVTCEGLLGLDARDGALLWRVPFKTGANRNVLTPILDDDTVTFASFTTGMRRLRINPTPTGINVSELWINRDLKINLSTPVLLAGHLYGHGPTRDFVCIETATGKVTWRQPGFDQYASVIASETRLIILTDAGEVILLNASPEKYLELGRFQACGKTFSHPAYANGVLITRDTRELSAWPLISPAR